MFLIREFHRLEPGRYSVTLETDDPGFLPGLRLIRNLAVAAERLQTRVDRERRVLHLLDKIHAAEPENRAERARLLAIFRELPGSRGDRLKALRRILADQYGRCAYDDARAIVSRATKERRGDLHARARELAAAGASCRAIGSQLEISHAQAARFSHPCAPPENGELLKCPRIDDLPRQGIQTGNHPGRSNPPGRKQGKTPGGNGR